MSEQKRRLEPGPVRMTKVMIANGGGAGGYVSSASSRQERQRQKERLLRRKGVSEESRVSSVFPEVRSAGGAKIKVEALLLKSGISGCARTSTRARPRGSGGGE